MAAVVEPREIMESIFARKLEPERSRILADYILTELSAAGWWFWHDELPAERSCYRRKPAAEQGGGA